MAGQLPSPRSGLRDQSTHERGLDQNRHDPPYGAKARLSILRQVLSLLTHPSVIDNKLNTSLVEEPSGPLQGSNESWIEKPSSRSRAGQDHAEEYKGSWNWTEPPSSGLAEQQL